MNAVPPRSRAVSPALLLLAVALPVSATLLWYFADAGAFRLDRPFALLLLGALPLAYWVTFRLRARRRARLGFGSTAVLTRVRPGLVARLSQLPAALRLVALGLIVIALARPQTQPRGGTVELEGIDVMLALDLSGSMKARDLRPNRLEAAKRVIDAFIARRQSDRIGLVVFGKEAFTQCPLTLDYSVLRTMLAGLQLGMIDGSATAIGNAVALSLARLRKSDAKSRVIILLTDGESNSGNVAPKEAARYARALKVKVFTVLMGPSTDEPVAPRRDFFGRTQVASPTNPELLRHIARETGGQAYNATDRRALEQNFEQILDELEKSSRRDVGAVFTDAHLPFVIWALALIALAATLRLTRMREFP
jgi:Ca-activated chloride channel family protein